MSSQKKPLSRFRLLIGFCLLLLVLGLLLFSRARVSLRTSIVLSDGLQVRTETYADIREPDITYDQLGGPVTFLTLDFTAGGVKKVSITLTSDGLFQADGVRLAPWPLQPGVRDLFQKARAILAS